jgi:hypothetical protein
MSTTGGQLGCPEGIHTARVVALVEVGTHEDEFDGKVRRNKLIYVAYEIYTREGTFLAARDYTASLAPKAALRAVAVAVLGGRALADGTCDLNDMLGKPCMVSMESRASASGKSYSKLIGVTPIHHGLTCPPVEQTPIAWCIGDGFDKLPGWLPYLYGEVVTEKINRSPEGKAANAALAADTMLVGAAEEPIPY